VTCEYPFYLMEGENCDLAVDVSRCRVQHCNYRMLTACLKLHAFTCDSYLPCSRKNYSPPILPLVVWTTITTLADGWCYLLYDTVLAHFLPLLPFHTLPTARKKVPPSPFLMYAVHSFLVASLPPLH